VSTARFTLDTLTPPPSRPLAIIGIGCLFPGSTDFAGFWSRIVNKVDAIREVPPSHWQPADYLDPDPKAPDRVYSARGGFLEPIAFHPGAFGIPPSNLEATDSSQLLGLLVAQQALEDCGYTIARGSEEPGGAGKRVIDRSRISVILGVTGTLELVIPLGARLGHPIWRRALAEAGVAPDVAEDVVRRIGDAYVPWQENSFPGLLGNVVAGRIANRFDLGGTNCVVDAACASSLGAIHLAALELSSGRADVVLTGGVDTFNDIFMFTCFSKTPALSPTGNARPFDAAADGTVLGEGLGMVVLKRLEDARRDGDRIYAVLRGVGSSSDGKGNAIYAPRREGQIQALGSAYRAADISPETIELVEAHGTGTRVGDGTEVGALDEVYRATGRKGTWCALGSIKSQLGHTKAAAGVAGLLKAAAALHHKVLPPTIKVTRPLEAVAEDGPFYVNAEKRPWLPEADHPRRAAVSAFGFGGSNFHCVLEEAEPEKAEIDWTGEVQIVALCGPSKDGLAQALEQWPAALEWAELRLRADRSRRNFDPAAPWRLLLVVQRERGDLAKVLARARSVLDESASRPVSLPAEGVWLGSGSAEGRLAVLFPGQGAQYPGMLRDLACHFPPALAVLAAAGSGFREERGQKLGDLIYPQSAFTPQAKAAQEEALRATDVAQPALGAVCLGAWRVLEHFGARADAFAGHSYGELTALCAAGRLAEEDLHGLSRLRGRLMAEAGRAGGDTGGMLAVRARQEVIAGLLREEGIDLVLANKNAPEQTVLSGPREAIDRAAAAFSRRKVSNVRLGVAAAFHSPLVAAARLPFLGALAEVELSAGHAPVFANSTAEPYPEQPAAARDLLGNQLVRPVEWVREVEALHVWGARTFLEVGPGAKLTPLVEAVLPGKAAAAALDASSGQRGGFLDLAGCLAFLAARGHAVNLSLWDPAPAGEPPARKASHAVTLCGANYVQPRQPRPAASRNGEQAHVAATEPVAASLVAATCSVAGSASGGQASRLPPRERTAPATGPDAGGQARPLAATEKTMTMKDPTPPVPLDNGAVGQALQITRESLAALQRMQEQTAQLHRRFLDGQEQAHRTVHLLMEQQQRLLQASLGLPVAPLPALPAPPPAPALPPPAAPAAAPPVAVVPVAAPAPPPPPPPPAIQPAVEVRPEPSTSHVEGVLLEVIAEKTGYPTDMLELTMALDADLGIDSIKRVEILSALQERLPDAPAVKPEHLGTLHTLGDIAAFLAQSAPAAPIPSASSNGVNGHAPSPVPAAAPPVGRVQGVLLEVIAEKTGYPTDMLELTMALDADLGIDSIKRVEILSALQERLPDAPAVKPEHLGTLHTLGDIAAFLAQSAPAAPIPAPVRPKEKPAAPPPAPAPAAPLERSIPVVVPLPPAAAPDVHLPAGADVWVGADDAELAEAARERLAARGLRPHVAPCRELARLPAPTSLGGLLILAPATAPTDDWLRDCLLAARQAGPALRKTRGALLTVSRLDGAFGLAEPAPRRGPLDGGLAGLAKTAGHEWPEVNCKALDLSPGLSPERAAAAVEQEMLLRGPAEVGRTTESRVTLGRTVQAATAGRQLPFEPGDVVVVSGGARGVTAEAAVALAKHFRPTLVVLGRTALPQSEPEWLAGLSDEAALKRELARRNPGASPRAVSEEVRAVLAAREVARTLQRIREAGATALYCAVDVRDAAAVAEALEDVRRRHGPVRGLIHGAGVLADARIEDKTAEQFDAVYGTKVGGLRNLLAAVADDDLRALVLFSSSTARFGRAGQADYAIANEVLNKLAWQEAARRPACRVVSLNWGPWDGGMVTPSLKGLFAREGIGVIPLQAGAELLCDELRLPPPGPREVVVLAAGSAVPAATAPSAPVAAAGPALPSPLPAAFERVLDVEEFPVLKSHVLDGRPVVPLALLLEWLAHAALVQNPGYTFHGCDDLRVLHGITVQSERLTLRVGAAKAVRRDGMFIASAEVRSRGGDGRETLHARAEVLLVSALPAAPPAREAPLLPAFTARPAEMYRKGTLFHGPAMQGLEQIDGCGEPGITGQVRSAPAPASWLRQPLRQHWLSDPLIIDGAFQLMVLWSQEQRGAACLPCHARRYRQYRRSFPAGGVRVVAAIDRATDLHALADIDFLDAEGKLVARIEGHECVIDPALQRAFQRNQLIGV
jgi:acyl transferase domain-containing protein/acyl carrier protein